MGCYTRIRLSHPHLPTSRTPAQTELVSTMDLQSSALWHQTLLIAHVNDNRLDRLLLHWPPVVLSPGETQRSVRIQLSWPHRVVAIAPLRAPGMKRDYCTPVLVERRDHFPQRSTTRQTPEVDAQVS